jgi:membrane protein YqaA with SNARE-associated domain
MLESIWINGGYLGLFGVSCLAATLLPFSSEAVVAGMIASHFSASHVLVVATAGNYTGALINYWVGCKGGLYLLERVFKVEDGMLLKARSGVGRWGAPALFFAWLPIIGDPLTVAAGTLRLNLILFSFWVILGKLLRYGAIVGGVQWGMG